MERLDQNSTVYSVFYPIRFTSFFKATANACSCIVFVSVICPFSFIFQHSAIAHSNPQQKVTRQGQQLVQCASLLFEIFADEEKNLPGTTFTDKRVHLKI